jgi:hypothetical protein
MINEIATFKDGFSIAELEVKMLKYEQANCPVIHRFGPGLYIREVHLPAGALAIGHHQKYEHMNFFLQGRVTMLNDDGTNSELTAPMIFTARPGRKVGYIHEDVVWLNVYPTTETDVETLESTYLDKSDSWKENKKLQDMIRAGNYLSDNSDYKKLLADFGFTEKEARQQSEDEADQIPMPFGDYKILISDSCIEGKGVFASADIETGEVIGPARIEGKRTPIGRYVNHSIQPNAKMINSNGDIYLIAVSEIHGCKGGLPGDEITTDYRNSLKLIGRERCQQ